MFLLAFSSTILVESKVSISVGLYALSLAQGKNPGYIVNSHWRHVTLPQTP
uniref:Uncharacterized protein n=1 Tax=Rhizophora mucronata TaxID=61149 RepID=A0A2P2Q8Y8_RHIMU